MCDLNIQSAVLCPNPTTCNINIFSCNVVYDIGYRSTLMGFYSLGFVVGTKKIVRILHQIRSRPRWNTTRGRS